MKFPCNLGTIVGYTVIISIIWLILATFGVCLCNILPI